MADSGFVKVADLGDLSPGDMMAVEVGGEQVLLANAPASRKQVLARQVHHRIAILQEPLPRSGNTGVSRHHLDIARFVRLDRSSGVDADAATRS